jgi:hypothetical protein
MYNTRRTFYGQENNGDSEAGTGHNEKEDMLSDVTNYSSENGHQDLKLS